ncbi:MAG: hypothetical protein O3B38_00425 [Chloroflexi bacterium]|nr:hypothetical protein [Chloroflexota bacterium]
MSSLGKLLAGLSCAVNRGLIVARGGEIGDGSRVKIQSFEQRPNAIKIQWCNSRPAVGNKFDKAVYLEFNQGFPNWSPRYLEQVNQSEFIDHLSRPKRQR